jgi:hypothetical protein
MNLKHQRGGFLIHLNHLEGVAVGSFESEHSEYILDIRAEVFFLVRRIE